MQRRDVMRRTPPQGLTLADLPIALVYYELISIAWASGLWLARPLTLPSRAYDPPARAQRTALRPPRTQDRGGLQDGSTQLAFAAAATFLDALHAFPEPLSKEARRPPASLAHRAPH